MKEQVVVTGIGAVTCFGNGVDRLWRGLTSGTSGIRTQPILRDAGMAITTGAGLDDEAARAEVAVARQAIDEAAVDAGAALEEAAFVWACGLDAVSLRGAGDHLASGATFDALAARFRWPTRRLATACAAGAHAVAEAFELVRRGRIGRCFAGGSSMMLSPFYVHGLGQLGVLGPDRGTHAVCRPFDRRRNGTALGDGAGAVVVETLRSARARGASPIATLRGAAITHDAHDFFRPPDDGRGLEDAIRRALDDADASVSQIGAIVAHATGTIGGDTAEARAICRVLGDRVRVVPITAPKGALGHTMMAAGAIGAVIGCRIASEGVTPPTAGLTEPDPSFELAHVLAAPRPLAGPIVLVHACGMGGHDVVLALERLEYE